MKEYTSKVELTNAIKASYKKYIDEFENISEDFKLEGIDEKYRWIIAPTIASTILVDRLAFHFEDNTKHSLDIRRYYRQFNY